MGVNRKHALSPSPSPCPQRYQQQGEVQDPLDQRRPSSDGAHSPSARRRRAASLSLQRQVESPLQRQQQQRAESPRRVQQAESPRHPRQLRGQVGPGEMTPQPPKVQPWVDLHCSRETIRMPAASFSLISRFMEPGALPSFRRACLCCHRVVSKRLTNDPALRSAVDGLLEERRLRSKRVWVVVRARPTQEAITCLSLERNRVSVRGAASPYYFDRAFGESASQQEVCNYINDRVLPHALHGEHVCILAYGQTGSGKTHTMFGSLDTTANQGVAFRAVNQLAGLLRSAGSGFRATVEFSFLEVYNDELYDLLDAGKRLPRQRSAEKHVVPQGLSRRRCELDNMEHQVHAWLRQGAATRTEGRTVVNPRSSRSHAVVMLHLRWGRADGGQHTQSRLQPTGRAHDRGETRIYIVDLAGSERAGMYAIDKEQLKEGEHINLSLSALGRVVGALASGKCEHVPYRDSALTWLLKDSITGTSARVCMVAAVHPAHVMETSSTLRYAMQYSCLQSPSKTRMPELVSEVREIQRRVDRLQKEVDIALNGDDSCIQWTLDVLDAFVQPSRFAKDAFENHPHLVWTQAHNSKSLLRGQRRDASGVGRARTTVELVYPRSHSETADGRPLAGSTAAKDIASCRARRDLMPEPAVEVVFEGKNGRPPVVLWYPASALEKVLAPKNILDALSTLKVAEEDLARKRGELQKVKDECKREQQAWMARDGD